METIRKITKNKFFATIMSFVLLFTSSYQVNAINIEINVNAGLSGEEMFREIFFFQGNIPIEDLPTAIQEEVNSLKNFTKSEQEKRDEALDNVVNIIKQTNPDYFDNLKNAVQSKNHYEVKKEIAVGGTLIINALDLGEAYDQIVQYSQDKRFDLSNNEDIERFKKDINVELSKVQYSPDSLACFAVCLAVVAV